ncbi:MAG: hypothetical protein EG825_16355 [Rhodocyclaceae bacterium]|nr:hypothetical protein [Rhodocyclaceae bacterium]
MNEICISLAEGREHDPFRILGLHRDGANWVLRVFRPHAAAVLLVDGASCEAMTRLVGTDLFEWRGATPPARPWRLRIEEDGIRRELTDPYAFPPKTAELDLHLFAEGTNTQAYRFLGAVPETRDGVSGTVFRVWAPNAGRVSVVGEFNRWDGRCHPMASLGASGAKSASPATWITSRPMAPTRPCAPNSPVSNASGPPPTTS